MLGLRSSGIFEVIVCGPEMQKHESYTSLICLGQRVHVYLGQPVDCRSFDKNSHFILRSGHPNTSNFWALWSSHLWSKDLTVGMSIIYSNAVGFTTVSGEIFGRNQSIS